jgi:cytochrome P450
MTRVCDPPAQEDAMAKPRIDLAGMITDPFETLRRARAAGWIAESDDGSVVTLRYEQVRQLLTDDRLHSNFVEFMRVFGVTSGPFYEWMAISPLNRDGPDHLRWRALMMRAFTPRSVERLRPFLRDAAHQLIDGFAATGRCDFVAAFADVYPSLGLCELIGVPQEDRDRFRGWANTIGFGFSALEMAARIGEIDGALTHLLAYTGALAAARRAEPRDDLVSRIAQAADEEGGWSALEVRGFIAGLVFAGHETTKNQLGWMLAVLSERRDIWDAVAAGALPVADVVEEVMRYRSAATGAGRSVAEPVACDGVTLEPGTRVFLSLWSANHDESIFPAPDRFDPRANGQHPHIAFGYGPHHCIGAALARAELREALAALTARLHCPTLLDGAAWKPAVGINGPERLPIGFALRVR